PLRSGHRLSGVANRDPRDLTSGSLQTPSRSLTARDGLTQVCSVQRRIVRPDILRMRVRLRELFDCHLQATNDHRGYTKALRLLGHIVEHVLECGSISHMLIRTISHMLLRTISHMLL